MDENSATPKSKAWLSARPIQPGTRLPVVPAADLASRLSPSQKRVAAMLACGLSKKEIAKATACSTKTIENHTERIYKRLGINGVVLLTRFVVHAGLLVWAEPELREEASA